MTRVAPRPARGDEVPVLDMAPLIAGGDVRALARQVRAACEDMAFFYVRNHGVAEAVIGAAVEASKRFFSCPVEARLETCPRYARRKTITRFVTFYELFKLALPVKGSVVECGVLAGV